MEAAFRHYAALLIKHLPELLIVTLDCDENSVAWLDVYVAGIKKELSPGTIDYLTGLLGSFIGECLRHRYSGEWRQIDGQWAIAFGDKNTALPFNKVRRHFETDHDSILSFFNLIPILFKDALSSGAQPSPAASAKSVKCPQCGAETYRAIGGTNICPRCGFGSSHDAPYLEALAHSAHAFLALGREPDTDPLKVRKIESPERRAYREAGHAVMSYLLRQGFANQFVPIGRSLMLPAFRQVSIVGQSGNWAETTFSLGSFITVPQVLIAGPVAEHIQYKIQDETLLRTSKQMSRAWGLLEGYYEEYRGDRTGIPVLLTDMIHYVDELLREHWASVEALAQALLQKKLLSEAEAFAVIEKEIRIESE